VQGSSDLDANLLSNISIKYLEVSLSLAKVLPKQKLPKQKMVKMV
jgi:hypothetical protein